MGLASGYLGLLHCTILCLGLAYIGISIYLLVTGYQYLPSGANSIWTAIAPLIFGIVVSFIALIGCCCESINKNKCFIILFAFLQFVFGAVIIAAGAVLIVVAGDYAANIAASDFPTEDVEPGTFGSQQILSDYLLGLYAGCCNDTLTECPVPTFAGKNVCYLNEDVYDAGVDSIEQGGSQFCLLNNLDDTCGNAGAFLEETANLLKTYVWPSGIAFCVFGSLLMIAFVASCCLLGSRSQDSKPKARQQTAGETAYGKPAEAQRNDINYA